MTAISWQSALIISSMVTRKIYGEELVAYETPVYVGIWPVLDTTGPKATVLTVVPKADVNFAIGATAETVGLNSARLIKDTEYVFPLHPDVQTICFLDAQSTSGAVYLKWMLG